MALWNESLAGRLNEAIARLHGSKGHPPAPQISPEIQHVLQIEPPGAEHRPLAGWRSFFGIVALPASATAGTISLTNPNNSNVLAVIERMLAFEAGTALSMVLDVRGNITQAGPGTKGFSRDSRIISGGTRAVSACFLQGVDPDAGGSDLGSMPADFAVGLNSIFQVIKGGVDEQVLTQNDGFGVQKLTANATQLTVACWWRERAILESEIKL